MPDFIWVNTPEAGVVHKRPDSPHADAEVNREYGCGPPETFETGTEQNLAPKPPFLAHSNRRGWGCPSARSVQVLFLMWEESQQCRNQGLFSMNKLSVTGTTYVNSRVMSL